MPLSVNLVTPPIAEPVTLTEVHSQCRIDPGYTGDDTLLEMYITAARQWAEKYMNRAIYNQTWTRTLDHFPLWWSPNGTVNPNYRNDWPYYSDFWNRITIDVPLPKTQAVESITYVDMNGVTQTLAASDYVVDLTSTPSRIVPAQGTYWPSEMTYIPGSVVITFVAGSYGDGVTLESCPSTIKMAILLLISHWYEHRVASEGTLAAIPFGVESLLDPYVITYTGFRPL